MRSRHRGFVVLGVDNVSCLQDLVPVLVKLLFELLLRLMRAQQARPADFQPGLLMSG